MSTMIGNLNVPNYVICQPYWDENQSMVLGKDICTVCFRYSEAMTGQLLESYSSIAFMGAGCFPLIAMSYRERSESTFKVTKHLLYADMERYNMLNSLIDPYVFGNYLCDLAFNREGFSKEQRREHLAQVIFKELRCDKEYFKIAMGWYLFQSANIWRKIPIATMAERFELIKESYDFEWTPGMSTYQAPGKYNQGIEFSLTGTFTITEEILRALFKDFIDDEKIRTCINLFQEKELLDTPIDAKAYGSALAIFFYRYCSESVRCQIQIPLLTLPLLISQSLFLEVMLCEYFEKNLLKSR